MSHFSSLVLSAPHLATLVPVDKYCDTKTFLEAELDKFKKKQSATLELVKEVAVESLAGFIGIAHLYKTPSQSPQERNLEVSVKYREQTRMTADKSTYVGIKIFTGYDPDTLSIAFVPKEEIRNRPWIKFFPAEGIVIWDNFSTSISANFPKPVTLKSIKQE